MDVHCINRAGVASNFGAMPYRIPGLPHPPTADSEAWTSSHIYGMPFTIRPVGGVGIRLPSADFDQAVIVVVSHILQQQPCVGLDQLDPEQVTPGCPHEYAEFA
eukprot:5233312-Amphidinium_carterae.1